MDRPRPAAAVSGSPRPGPVEAQHEASRQRRRRRVTVAVAVLAAAATAVAVPVHLVAEARSSAPSAASLVLTCAADGVSVRDDRVAATETGIALRVVDGTGAPLPGASVGYQDSQFGGSGVAELDGDGRGAAPVAPGPATFWCSSIGSGTSGSVTVTDPGGFYRGVDVLDCGDSAGIVGLAADASTGVGPDPDAAVQDWADQTGWTVAFRGAGYPVQDEHHYRVVRDGEPESAVPVLRQADGSWLAQGVEYFCG